MLPKTKRAIFVRLLFFGKFIGGDEGGRTPDLCNAIAALCQTELRPHFSMLRLKIQQKPNRKYNNPPLIKQLQTDNLQVEISALFTFKIYARIIILAVSPYFIDASTRILKTPNPRHARFADSRADRFSLVFRVRPDVLDHGSQSFFIQID
jgi:hypothetical protein